MIKIGFNIEKICWKFFGVENQMWFPSLGFHNFLSKKSGIFNFQNNLSCYVREKLGFY